MGAERRRRVVVVGAGPAGSAAAIALSQFSGIDVLLVDREHFPRRKACGSGLSPWTLSLLDSIGVGAAVRRHAYPIGAALIGGSNGPPVELRGPHHAAVLLRSRFDSLLAEEAVRRGATRKEGTLVQGVERENGRVVGLTTTEGGIEADAVIDCSGANTRLSRDDRPGTTLHAILAWYEGVSNVSDAVELYFDRAVKPYYGWVFPESAQRVNVGLCYKPAPGTPNARERLADFVERRLAGRMSSAALIEGPIGHPIATTYRPSVLVRQGMLVAGEAASLVDPATAEGIYEALVSGTSAGRTLGSVLERGLSPTETALSPYTPLLRRQIGRRLLAGHLFVQVLKTPLLDFALSLGSRKTVKAALTRVLAGA
jgi:menaquinone-9 beta-reductase